MRRLLRRRNTRRWRQPRRRRRQRRRRRGVATRRRWGQRRCRRSERHWRRRRCRRWQRHRCVRVGEGACGVGGVATARGSRAVLTRRRNGRRRRISGRRHRGRLAVALAVDHVLDVHVAALVRVRVDCGRRGRGKCVGTVRTPGQRHHFGALEELVEGQPFRWAALAVDLMAVDRRADHVLAVVVVVVGVPHRHGRVALPDVQRRWWRHRRRRRRPALVTLVADGVLNEQGVARVASHRSREIIR